MTVLAIMLLFPVFFYVSACYLAFGYKGALTSARLVMIEKKVSEGGNKGFMQAAIAVFVLMSVILLGTYMLMKTVGDPRVYLSVFLVFVMTYCFIAHLRGGVAWAQVSWGILIDLLVAGLVCCVWLSYPNWMTANLFGIVVGMRLLVIYRNVSLQLCLALSIGIITYDALHVFGTRIMQEVASNTGASALGLLTIPSSLSVSAVPLMQIGLGDLVFPGFIVMVAYRIGKVWSAAGAIIGYVVGMGLTLWVNIHFNFPQPATIYLIPATFLGYRIATNFPGRKQEVL